jgi:hypothetical protein
VRELVQGCGALVLSVARASQVRQIAEVERAVDNLVRAGQGVRKNIAGAAIVNIGAVIRGGSRSCR